MVELSKACQLGDEWFGRLAEGAVHQAAAIDGASVGFERALERASNDLRSARRPVLYGLTRTSNECVREALALADRVGALVLTPGLSERSERTAAFQEVGKVTATLGEVKNRADLIVYWGGGPSAQQPRHAERYSMDAAGRFLNNGRASRFVIVVVKPGEAPGVEADLVIEVDPGRELGLLASLRARHSGAAEQLPDLLHDGLHGEAAETLIQRFRHASYGAIFFRPMASEETYERPTWVAVSALVRELNQGRRFVLMEYGKGWNSAGPATVMSWQAGFPNAIDFRLVVPSPVEDVKSLDEVLERQEVDALLVIADQLPAGLSKGSRDVLEKLPMVVIAPDACRRVGPSPTVAISSAATGLEVEGSVTRVDGVMLPLRPLSAARFPTDQECLKLLRGRL